MYKNICGIFKRNHCQIILDMFYYQIVYLTIEIIAPKIAQYIFYLYVLQRKIAKKKRLWYENQLIA